MPENVYEQIGFSKHEAANLKIRARLMMILEDIIKEEGLTQKEAARILGVSQPRVSDLVRGKIDRFTIDALVNMLEATGRKIRLETVVADSLKVLNRVMNSGIDNVRERITDLMRRRGVVRAGVFGSVARGDATDSSDVDFLVEFEKGRSLLDLAGLQLDLADLLNRNVDIATPESLHPEMRKSVLDELVPLL